MLLSLSTRVNFSDCRVITSRTLPCRRISPSPVTLRGGLIAGIPGLFSVVFTQPCGKKPVQLLNGNSQVESVSWVNGNVDSETAVLIAAVSSPRLASLAFSASLGLTESPRRPVREGCPRFSVEMTDSERGSLLSSFTQPVAYFTCSIPV